MTLEENLQHIHNALWCFDFENIHPQENDQQKTYLYALSTLLKKNKKSWQSKNLLERFKARKNLIALVNLWNKTVETGIATKGRVHDSVVINHITLPQKENFDKIIQYAKHEREKQLEIELSQSINENELNRKIEEMKAVFRQKDFDRLRPAAFDERNTYLYAFYLLMQKNEQALKSSGKVDRLEAKKNINTLASLWDKTVSTYSTIHPNRLHTIVVIENINFPEKEHYDKFVNTAKTWKAQDDAMKATQAKEIRERK